MKDILKQDYADGILTLTIVGEIDHHSAKPLREAIDAALFYHRPKLLRLVLSEVSFMDSSGIGLLLGRYTRMEELGGKTVLVKPTKQMMKLLSLAAIDKTIPIERQ